MHDDFDTGSGKNSVSVWTMADLYDAELLKGAYFDHRYPWHTHEEFSLGIVLAGGVFLQTLRSDGIAKRGSFVLINPDELHCGRPDVGGWLCRTLHVHPDVFLRVARDNFGITALPTFTSPVVDDPVLSGSLLELHRLSETACSALERQSRITAMIIRLLAHHTCLIQLPESGFAEPAAISLARAYLDENLSDKVTLDDLSRVVGLPAFQLLRAFRQTCGVTPHVYQLQARVRKAHKLLKSGVGLADVAISSGFADQPHLTRVFKSIMGATPGQYGRGRG